MRKQERLNRILELVVDSGNLNIDQAAQSLGVSIATVRRDFDELASRNLVSRSHGAVTALGSPFSLPISYKVAKQNSDKIKIAQKCVTLVERYQTIGLNGGTTTTEVARALGSSDKFAPDENSSVPALNILTNAVNIAAELTVRTQIKIVVTGGVAKTHSYELTGPLTESVIEEFAIDTAFIGIEGFDLELGALANFTDEARVNRAIAKRAAKVVIVTTSDKFNNRAFSVILKPEEIDCIITDDKIPPEIVKDLNSKGIDVIIA